jgi:hypothetical protein
MNLGHPQASLEPRHFRPGIGLEPGLHVGRTDAGLPGDRAARIAARKAFVDLKLTFLHTLRDSRGVDWLLAQVRAAEEPEDLWLLRGPVFSALSGSAAELRARRQLLRRGLDSVFPDLQPPSAFSVL